jgi:ribosomal protein L28
MARTTTVSLSADALKVIRKLRELEKKPEYLGWVKFNVSAACSRAVVEEGERLLRQAERAIERGGE